MAGESDLIKMLQSQAYVPATLAVAEQGNYSLARELFNRVPADPTNFYQTPFLELAGANDENTAKGAEILERSYRMHVEQLPVESLTNVYEGLLKKTTKENADKIRGIFTADNLKGKTVGQIERVIDEAKVVLKNPQRYDEADVKAAQAIVKGYVKYSQNKAQLSQLQITSLLAPIQMESIPKGLEAMANSA